MAALPKAEADFIREWITDAEANGTVDAAREEVMKQYALTRGQLNAILAWRKIYADRSIAQANSSSSCATPQDRTSVEVISRTGAHADYDNEKKERWRETWFSFVEKKTTPAQRKTMKVLCLPGKNCLEIPGYLRMGFQPENILGVEGDKSAHNEFISNSQKYGIRISTEKLEKFFAKTSEKFDVLSLDFHGCLSRTALSILEALPMSNHCYTMVNMLGMREKKATQQLLNSVFSEGVIAHSEKNK